MAYLTRILAIIFLGVLTVALLLRIGRLDLNLNTLQSLDIRYLVLAVVIHYSGFVVRGLRWRSLLLGLGHRLNPLYTTTLLLAGWFVSALLPARLGDVARLTILRRDHQIPISHGLASIASERALDLFAILGLMLAAALWALPGQVPNFVWQLAAGGAVMILILVIVCLVSPALETRLQSLLPWSIYQKAVSFGFDMLAGLRRLAQNPVMLAWVIGQSVYIWLCDILLMHLIFLSTSQVIPLSTSAFSSMAVDLAAAVPIIPGAIGQFEGAAVAIFSLFDLNLQQSSLVILLNRLVSFWTFLIFSGTVTYLFGFAQIFNKVSLQAHQTLLPDN